MARFSSKIRWLKATVQRRLNLEGGTHPLRVKAGGALAEAGVRRFEAERSGLLRITTSGLNHNSEAVHIEGPDLMVEPIGIFQEPYAPLESLTLEFFSTAWTAPLVLRLGTRVFDLPSRLTPYLRQRPPAYEHLFTTERPLERGQIYGSGPPNKVPNFELLDLIPAGLGKTLDFGCGSGALVAELRCRGTEAVGLELDEQRIHSSILSDAEPFVSLYDGSLPLPFGDANFRSVIATEVLEHIIEWEQCLKELRRVTAHQLFVTVPDMTSIPLSFEHGTVPWHLLESTHVNFFTYRSLRHALSPLFSRVDFFRISNNHLNGHMIPGSLVAICTI